MLTLVLYGLLAIVLAAVLFLVAAFLLPAGEQIAPPIRDEPSWDLPGRRIHHDDIAAVRLPVALRGYRFAETDRLLDRLAEELGARDEEIQRLRSGEEREQWAVPPADADAADDPADERHDRTGDVTGDEQRDGAGDEPRDATGQERPDGTASEQRDETASEQRDDRAG